jgi:hypothetical protein
MRYFVVKLVVRYIDFATSNAIMPAQAGIPKPCPFAWIPTFAGMTQPFIKPQPLASASIVGNSMLWAFPRCCWSPLQSRTLVLRTSKHAYKNPSIPVLHRQR